VTDTKRYIATLKTEEFGSIRWPHTSPKTIDATKKLDFTIFPQPLYGPDLVHCDLHIFQKLKTSEDFCMAQMKRWEELPGPK
jgi:hypothetical protein